MTKLNLRIMSAHARNSHPGWRNKEFLETATEAFRELNQSIENSGQSPQQILFQLQKELSGLFNENELFGIINAFLGLKPTLNMEQKWLLSNILEALILLVRCDDNNVDDLVVKAYSMGGRVGGVDGIITSGHLDLLRLLINNGYKASNKDFRLALDSRNYKDALKILVEEGGYDINAPIVFPTTKRAINSVWLVANNWSCSKKYGLIEVAAKHYDVLKLLISLGADIKFKAADPYFPQDRFLTPEEFEKVIAQAREELRQEQEPERVRAELAKAMAKVTANDKIRDLILEKKESIAIYNIKNAGGSIASAVKHALDNRGLNTEEEALHSLLDPLIAQGLNDPLLNLEEKDELVKEAVEKFMRSAHPEFCENNSAEDYIPSGAAYNPHVASLGDLGSAPSADSDLE